MGGGAEEGQELQRGSACCYCSLLLLTASATACSAAVLANLLLPASLAATLADYPCRPHPPSSAAT